MVLAEDIAPQKRVLFGQLSSGSDLRHVKLCSFFWQVFLIVIIPLIEIED